MIGTTISHYKILEKLGEGGMGVVYKAEDTKLDRTVALKFLPAHVSINEDTKARFMQEAKAAAALNHANICTIHGVEEDAGQMFIVMEYIDGGTLRQKIPFSSIEEAVGIGIQIGDALQEAHSKGIVHRDIKADNIMLTSKGQAKVMDFGLAKLKGSLKITKTSSTVGTLGYMAPEQIQGGEVDLRSDIFSFGVLLFEMLTGKLPFRGEHEAAMVYSIVNEEPQPVEQFRQEVSPLLANLINRCLEKDPADRYQHMDDLVSELRRTQKKTSRISRSSDYRPQQPQTAPMPSGVVPQVEAPAPSSPGMNLKNPLVRYGILGIGVVIIGVVAWSLFSPKGITVNPDMKTEVLQIPFTQYSYPSLSPDGKWLAFPAADANGKWDIYYMHVGGGEPRKITSDATGFIQQTADISPDGGQIVYDRPNDAGTSYDIFSVSALGGTSRRLAGRGSSEQWSPDGQRVGFVRLPTNPYIRSRSRFVEFWTVGADGTGLRKEFEDTLFVAKGNYRFNFCWAPDGKSIAWIRSLSTDSQVLLTHNLESGVEDQLTAGGENIDAMKWTKDDRIIFSSNRAGNTNLWAIPASGGEAVQVTKGGGPDLGLSVAASGNELICLQQQRVSHIWTANMDGSNLRQVTFDDREIEVASFSPDGKRIAFTMHDPDPMKVQTDAYVMDRDGNNRRRLTNGLASSRFPQWSPDGRRILYFSSPTGRGTDTVFKSFVVDVDNPGPPRFAGNYVGLFWADNDHLIGNGSHLSTYIMTPSTATGRQFFMDSVSVFSWGNGRKLGYYDWHAGKRGWWVVNIKPTTITDLLKQTGEMITPNLQGPPRKISSAPSFIALYTSAPTEHEDIFQSVNDDQVRRISFSREKDEILPARFHGLHGGGIQISRDGKEIIFAGPLLSSRLILMQNVFK